MGIIHDSISKSLPAGTTYYVLYAQSMAKKDINGYENLTRKDMIL
jgi:hypothetical protein